LAEIGFVDPVFGKKNFKNKYGRKKVCGPEFFQSSQSFGLHNNADHLGSAEAKWPP